MAQEESGSLEGFSPQEQNALEILKARVQQVRPGNVGHGVDGMLATDEAEVAMQNKQIVSHFLQDLTPPEQAKIIALGNNLSRPSSLFNMLFHLHDEPGKSMGFKLIRAIQDKIGITPHVGREGIESSDSTPVERSKGQKDLRDALRHAEEAKTNPTAEDTREVSLTEEELAVLAAGKILQKPSYALEQAAAIVNDEFNSSILKVVMEKLLELVGILREDPKVSQMKVANRDRDILDQVAQVADAALKRHIGLLQKYDPEAAIRERALWEDSHAFENRVDDEGGVVHDDDDNSDGGIGRGAPVPAKLR